MWNRLLHGDAEEDRTVTFVHALHMQQMWRLLELPVRTPRRVMAGLWGHDGWWASVLACRCCGQQCATMAHDLLVVAVAVPAGTAPPTPAQDQIMGAGRHHVRRQQRAAQ